MSTKQHGRGVRERVEAALAAQPDALALAQAEVARLRAADAAHRANYRRLANTLAGLVSALLTASEGE